MVLQCHHHSGHGHSGGAGIPNAEGTEAVGVDVFGAFDQLGKGSDRRLGGLGFGGVNVEQNGAIALDDQRIVGGIGHQAQVD